MANLFKAPNDSGGFDSGRNTLVLPINTTDTIYLVAGSSLTVTTSDRSIVAADAGAGDDPGSHKLPQLSEWETAQNIRRITLKSGLKPGTALLRAQNSDNRDLIAPLTVMVVNDRDARRVTDALGIDPAMKAELGALSLRQTVLRIAEDQLHSRVKTNTQGCALYHLNPDYGVLWCGAFAHWCWQQAALVHGVDNPFGKNNDVLLSPQKAIHWGMRADTPSQLLQYGGPDPMTMKDPPQELREIGYMGYQVEPGDVALWRTAAMTFKHVSFVESVSGRSFVDLNGNAYDAGSGSALARVSHSDIGARNNDKSYRCIILHLTI